MEERKRPSAVSPQTAFSDRQNDLKCLPHCSGHNQRKVYFYFCVCRTLRSAPNAFSRRGVVAGDDICSAAFGSAEATPSGSLRSPAPPRGRLCTVPDTLPLCQGLSLWESWQSRQALTERASPLTKKQLRQECSIRKRSRRTSSVQRLLLMVAYFRLKVAGSKSGSSQLRVMISVRSFRMAMECSK